MVHVLAVSSGGGHWQQLRLLSKAFDGTKVTYACSADVGDATVLQLPDCNLKTPLRLVRTLIEACQILWRVRPEVIVSTGAAPGVLVLILGKCVGCRTVWIDSVANVQRMSLSGRVARRFSDLWMTQWKPVALKTGATYAGAVL